MILSVPFHRVLHENLVTMGTKLKIERQIVTVSLLYDRKVNLLISVAFSKHGKTYE